MTSKPSKRPSIWSEPPWAESLAEFLRRCPGELGAGPVEPTPAGWFDGRRAVELARVHRQMLRAAYHADEQRHGRPDYWVVDISGDCEDKALWCHRRLADLGWPKASMRLWTCLARLAGRWRGHAVLVVTLALTDGEVVEAALDSRHGTPLRKADLGYRFWRVVDPLDAAKETGAAGQD